MAQITDDQRSLAASTYPAMAPIFDAIFDSINDLADGSIATTTITAGDITSTGALTAANTFDTYTIEFTAGDDGDNVIYVVDNFADALRFRIAPTGNYLMGLRSTNSDEAVEFPAAVECTSTFSVIGDAGTKLVVTPGATSLVLAVTSATGEADITLTDHLADALSIKIAGGNDLMVFTTTNNAEGVAITPALTPTGGVVAAGGFTARARCVHTGGVPAQTTSFGTNAASNTDGTVYLAECFVPANMSVTGVAIFNGTAVAGNGKVMLYDSAGTRVAISASTAMAGTTAYQLIPFTGGPIAVVGPATYFIGAIYDTATHDLRGHTIGSFAAGEDAGNTYATDSTFATVTLPTTFATTTGPIASLY